MSQTVNKRPQNWTDENILDWAMGTVVTGSNVTDEEVAKEAAKRNEVPYESIEQMKSILTTESPAEEEEAPVEEVPVEPAPADVEPSAPVVEEPKPEEPVKEEPKVEQPKVEPVPEAEVTDPLLASFISDFDAYAESMRPGRAHAGKEGVIIQTKFYRTIQAIMRVEGSKFNLIYGALLSFVKENKDTLFSQRYAYRYFDMLEMAMSDRKNYERMMNLIISTCDPTTRSQAIKQIDLTATLSGFKNEEVHQKVLGFYQGL